ncbi:S8 family peptidase [bacterium]|nr:S8 family peptidase [bacterium]
MRFRKTEVYSRIDPRLQRLLERRDRGITTEATVSTSVGEIAVIAKVSDLDAWNGMSEVQIGAEVGSTPDGNRLVTARIPLSRLEYVRQQSFVISLKPGQYLRPALSATVEEIRSRKDLLPGESAGNQGEGVVVGIIDYGCDFAHQNFRNDDGSTRLLAIWNQGGRSSSSSPFGYGREYNQEEINQALQESEPYDALGYHVPTDEELAGPGTHGTHVMDIAAGNEHGTGTSGVAPKADLIFVELSTIPLGTVGELLETNFGHSIRLMEAIRYIFDKAGNRPCVVNFSLATNGGPHDGSNLAEQAIDAMVNEAPNRAAVIAAANSFADGIHAAGTVPNNGFIDLHWDIRFLDFTFNELEIWYGAGNQFRLEILLPNGDSIGSVDLGTSAELEDDQGNTLIFISHRQADPNNGDNVIGIFHEPNSGLPKGMWTLRLHGVQVTDGSFHAWIERDDRGPSQFAPPHDNSHTLGSISCGQKSIVVGSYDAHKPNTPLSYFSSSGPTRDGRHKPEISAPGHAVWAAHSRTGDEETRKSGTSMAAPAVAGVVALMLAEARARGLNLTTGQIRDILTKTTRKDPPDSCGSWHPRYGTGRVDASAAIKEVQAMESVCT